MNLLVFQHPAALPLDQLERPLAGRPQVFLDLVLHLVQLVLQAQELHLLKRPVRSLGGALTHLDPSRAEIVFESAESRDHGPVRILQPDQVSLAIGGTRPLEATRLLQRGPYLARPEHAGLKAALFRRWQAKIDLASVSCPDPDLAIPASPKRFSH